MDGLEEEQDVRPGDAHAQHDSVRGLLGQPARAADEFSFAVWAHVLHRLGTWDAEGAFVGTDCRVAFGGYRGMAFFTLVFHLKCQVFSSLRGYQGSW